MLAASDLIAIFIYADGFKMRFTAWHDDFIPRASAMLFPDKTLPMIRQPFDTSYAHFFCFSSAPAYTAVEMPPLHNRVRQLAGHAIYNFSPKAGIFTYFLQKCQGDFVCFRVAGRRHILKAIFHGDSRHCSMRFRQDDFNS